MIRPQDKRAIVARQRLAEPALAVQSIAELAMSLGRIGGTGTDPNRLASSKLLGPPLLAVHVCVLNSPD
jgi:hypothetical protein